MPIAVFQNIFGTVSTVFFWSIFLFAIFFFWNTRSNRMPFSHAMRWTVWGVFAFRALHAVALTIAQYAVWNSDPGTKIFAAQGIPPETPVVGSWTALPFLFGPHGYFIFYSFERFWLNVILTGISALVFYWFLALLKRYRNRFFDEGEVTLGALAVLLVGWPGFTLFIPLAFLSVIIVSIVRILFFKEKYTTLGSPFLLAVFLVFIFSNYLLAVTGLAVLKV